MRKSQHEVPALDVAEALYYMGQLAPEEIPDVASKALEEGYDGPTLAELAGLQRPTMREAGERFERALREMGRPPVPRREAGVRVARSIAARILSDEIDPYAGARRIWWDVWEECERPSELTTFVALASQYEDDFSHRREYLREIREEAKKLLYK